nr:ribonuclease H-like domain-containing protein [Tanacetum cinerariifolium]
MKSQKHGNKSGNAEVRGRAYAIGGGDANPDSNVVKYTFLLNDRYASMLFDSGTDKSFVLQGKYANGLRLLVKEYCCQVKLMLLVNSADSMKKIHVSALPNVDTLSNAIIYSSFASQSNSPQLNNDGLKQIDADYLKKMDLKWQMAMKGHFARECRSPKDTRRNVAAEPQRRNVPVEEEPTNYVVMAFTSLSSSSSDNKLRDNALVVLRQKFEKAEQERDDLKLKLEKFQTSLKNLSQLLASQTNDKTGLGYNTQVFTSSMFDCDEMFSFEADNNFPTSPIYDRSHSGDGYHAVPPPYTGTFMSPKPDLVFHDAPNVSDSEDDFEAEIPHNTPSFDQPIEQVKPPRPSVKPVEISIPANNHKTAIPKPKSHRNSRNRKACFIFTTAVSPNNVTTPRPAKTVVTKPHSPPRRHINRSQSPKPSNFSPKVTAAKAPMVNAVKGNWDKGVIDSGCSRHMIGNMSYLSDFEKLNGGYVAFGGNPKGGKISGKGKIRTGKLDFDDVYFFMELKFNLFSVSQMCDQKNSVLFIDTECLVLSPEFKLPDENQVLLRVPRENNMYNVDLKNIVPSGDLTCLFAMAISDESNLWHIRLGNINFKTINKLVKGNLVRGLPSKLFENNHTCVACKKGKQHRAFCKTKPNTDDDVTFGGEKPEFDGRKPESEVYVSPSSSAQTKKHDDKTKREAKGKSHVESSTRYRNLSAEFEDFSYNNINEDNAADSQVLAFWQISTNNTNTFSHADPSNTVVSPAHGKSSYVNTSQYPDDPNMPKLEDISYSNDEKDVGAEADFTNLETTITNTFSPADPSNTVVSPAHGKSSYVNTSQYPDDPNMPKLEDITYSNDEKDVGAEADFTNLETTITVNPIPTTSVHKDHHVTQIIGDLYLAT